MNKKYTLTTTLLLSALLLAACGDDKDAATPVKEQEPIEVKSEEPAKDEVVVEEPAKEVEKEEVAAEPAPATTPETKPEEPAKKEVASDVTASAQMPYTVKLASGFSLVQEEPGRDQIVHDANGSVFMRVQVATTEEDTYESVKNNALMYMNAVGEPTELTTAELAPMSGTNIAGWKNVTPDDLTVYVIAFEQNGLLGQLTIHDKNSASEIAQLLTMASTITKQ